MIQIAHIIRQIIEKGSIIIKSLELKIKEVSNLIKAHLTTTLIEIPKTYSSQLRFDE